MGDKMGDGFIRHVEKIRDDASASQKDLAVRRAPLGTGFVWGSGRKSGGPARLLSIILII